MNNIKKVKKSYGWRESDNLYNGEFYWDRIGINLNL